MILKLLKFLENYSEHLNMDKYDTHPFELAAIAAEKDWQLFTK